LARGTWRFRAERHELLAADFWRVAVAFQRGGGRGANAGWFSYTPLSESAFSSTTGTDYWIMALLVLGVGSVAGAINMIVTILTLRARA